MMMIPMVLSAIPAAPPLQTLWWSIVDAPGVLTSNNTYEAQALIYTLSGLANSADDGLALLIDNGSLDIDDGKSDEQWKQHFEASHEASFTTLDEKSLCGLVMALQHAFVGATLCTAADSNPDLLLLCH